MIVASSERTRRPKILNEAGALLDEFISLRVKRQAFQSLSASSVEDWFENYNCLTTELIRKRDRYLAVSIVAATVGWIVSMALHSIALILVVLAVCGLISVFAVSNYSRQIKRIIKESAELMARIESDESMFLEASRRLGNDTGSLINELGSFMEAIRPESPNVLDFVRWWYRNRFVIDELLSLEVSNEMRLRGELPELQSVSEVVEILDTCRRSYESFDERCVVPKSYEGASDRKDLSVYYLSSDRSLFIRRIAEWEYSVEIEITSSDE